ncbi:MAG: NAD-dependent epimerase/dehydratase family protein [Spirochaetaceae bacterium]|nr:NAD-dependent epimerase/dehydratase family protein [Spirochaetaceae bacterium]MDT8298545.1 NAD-dependent epimerase/dehydratase family protein [Spirochaetaceae bacterium]
MTDRVLVTGSYGQIGTELILRLRGIYGTSNVIATDITPAPEIIESGGPARYLDVTDPRQVTALVVENKITHIFHLAAILSGNGELNPQKCWDVNMNGLYNILETARTWKVKQVITPSSIAAFGPDTPKEHTPIDTILRPTTMYGITKVAGELLNEYYNQKYGVDARSLRFPGIVSHETEPGGGTTDYAVDMYVKAVEGAPYACFVTENTTLPFLYMPDALDALLELAEVEESRLIHRTFNITGFSASAADIAGAVKARIPDFQCTFEPDFRQIIAESWPRSIDDRDAREEWGWKPSFDLNTMSDDMIAKLRGKIGG